MVAVIGFLVKVDWIGEEHFWEHNSTSLADV